jgi:hypothetical protein
MEIHLPVEIWRDKIPHFIEAADRPLRAFDENQSGACGVG